MWVKEEITRGILKYFELNENAPFQNVYHAVKVVPKGQFIALNSYIRKDLKSVI